MITEPTQVLKIIDEVNHRPKLISVCIPSRGRVQMLSEAISSLKENAVDSSRIEFVFRVDEDDTETIEFLKTIEGANIVVGPNLGYAAHRERMGDMFRAAHGQFLLLTGDDHRFLTKGWDSYVAKHNGQVSIVFFGQDITFAAHGALVKTVGEEGISPYSTDILFLYLACALNIYARYHITVKDRRNETAPPSPFAPTPVPSNEPEWRKARQIVTDYVSAVDALFVPKTQGMIPTGHHAGTVYECFGTNVRIEPPDTGFIPCIG